MLRTKLLLFILSGALLFTACSDTTTDPGNDDGGDDGETPDPTATINNPGDGGEPLEGEVTFSVEGETESSFSEVRVLLDGEQIASSEDPSIPYETTIATQNYNNGDYNLVAELDVSDPDTTVSDTVSVTLENYLFTVETDGYIEYLNEYNEVSYMFISGPDGNVLREVELTSKSDGVMEFLPPSSLSDGAPESLSLTFADQNTDDNDREIFSLTTAVGLQPWSRISMSASSSSSEVSKRDMKVYMHNFDQTPLYTRFSTPNYGDNDFFVHYNSSLDTTISVTEGHDDLVINHTPDYRNVENPTPLYKWENDLTEMPDSVAYDVSSDFNEMVSHNVDIPSNVRVNYYQYYMTVAPNSFEEGDMFFAYFNTGSYGDANGSDSGLGMWVPEISDRSFITYMAASDPSNENISYAMQTPVGDFPDEFTPLDLEAQINNKSMDDVQLDISGNADYLSIRVTNSTDSYAHNWSVAIPDSTESFVFPKIADSLDQSVNNYDRSAFTFSQVYSSDFGKLDGYSDYLDWRFRSSDMTIIEWYNKTRYLNNSSSKEQKPAMSPTKQQMLRIHGQQKVKEPKLDDRHIR